MPDRQSSPGIDVEETFHQTPRLSGDTLADTVVLRLC
jgi:hypothetical protein